MSYEHLDYSTLEHDPLTDYQERLLTAIRSRYANGGLRFSEITVRVVAREFQGETWVLTINQLGEWQLRIGQHIKSLGANPDQWDLLNSYALLRDDEYDPTDWLEMEYLETHKQRLLQGLLAHMSFVIRSLQDEKR